MKTMIALCIFILTACGGKDFRTKNEVDCNGKEHEIAQFVIDCAKAANPLSDEEGEDLVKQCERTAVNTFCTSTSVVIEYKNGNCFNENKKITSCY
jgi:hypothetical protein